MATIGGFGGFAPLPLPLFAPLSAPAVAAAASGTTGTTRTRKSGTNKATTSEASRREKAKLHARKCRAKKKNEFEYLQEQERLLREENQRLRAVIRSRIPEDRAQAIVSACCYSDERVRHLNPYIQHAIDVSAKEEGQDGGGGGGGTGADLARSDFDLIESLAAARQPFILSDPRRPDNPIVYCSDAFCELTGYKRDQVIGRNCRFLQTPETDPRAVEAVRRAVDIGRDATTVLLNQKADGTTFWNRLFVAPLRDRHRRIVNYVGVQAATDAPKAGRDVDSMDVRTEESAPVEIKRISNTTAFRCSADAASMNVSPTPIIGTMEPLMDTIQDQMIHFEDSDDDDDDQLGDVDWTILAEALETDYADENDKEHEWGDRWIKVEDVSPSVFPVSSAALDRQLIDFVHRPRLFTTKVVRSEVINTLLTSFGDVTDQRFTAALDVLASIYKSSGVNACSKGNYLHLLDGSWRSLARPAYQGCLGMKNDGSFCYTLQTMSFGMFRPGNLRCSVQNTLTHISPASNLADGSPTIAPWSLRRELAVSNESSENVVGGNASQKYSMLKSYDIAISLTIEPGEDCAGPSPKSPISALKVVKGYMLPDPDVPNRLTIWFVGGQFSPVVEQQETKENEGRSVASKEWKELFGTEQKRTWSESFRDMGAKLLLGAELPAGMAADGTLSYQLHRPHGGHGVAYIDVLYYDERVLITRGNKGTIYCTTRDGTATLPPANTAQKPAGREEQYAKAHLSDKKRKVTATGNKKPLPAKEHKRAKLARSRAPKTSTGVVMGSGLPPAAPKSSSNVPAGNLHVTTSVMPMVEANNNRDHGIPQNQQLQQQQQQQENHHDGGVGSILSSVEAFFSWGA